MKDTTGRPLLRPARILYHPYRDEGKWKVSRVLEKTVPKGMTAFDVTLPEEFREFDAISWEYEEHMSWARRLGLTSLLPDFKGIARSGFAGVKDYLFPILSSNHRFVVERSAHAENGPFNAQAPATLVFAPPGPATPTPPAPQPPSASLRPKSGSLKVRGQPFITTWHRSRAPYPLTHPPAAGTLDPALSSGDLYMHNCTNPLAARPVQLWMLRGQEDGASWVEVCEGHAHPELRGHRLHVRADGMLTWVTRKTVTCYKARGRKRLLGRT